MKKGFYLYFNGNEYFYISDKQKKCKSVALAFLNKLGAKVTETSIESILKIIMPATLEHKPYGINIYGANFGGYGDERTVIF